MSLFDIDWERFTADMTLRRLRRPAYLAWLRACIAPVIALHTKLLAYRDKVYYDLSHTSQVCKMEGALNDVFDPLQRRIYILDAPDREPLWIYRRAEQKPVAVFRRQEQRPRFMYRRIETSAGLEFVVCVPAAVQFDMAHLRALVDKYKLPSSVYTVKIV